MIKYTRVLSLRLQSQMDENDLEKSVVFLNPQANNVFPIYGGAKKSILLLTLPLWNTSPQLSISLNLTTLVSSTK